MRRLAALATTIAAAAATHGWATPPAAPSGPNTDPRQIVCVTESKTGSRLDRRRVCRTRAEWAEHRTQFRNSVERAQNQTQTQCVPTPTMQC